MTLCNRCTDKIEYEWYEDFQGKWKLGLKLDINNYRQHKCSPQSDTPQGNNKRNWIKFNCISCGKETRQNIKIIKSKTINLCYDCDNQC